MHSSITGTFGASGKESSAGDQLQRQLLLFLLRVDETSSEYHIPTGSSEVFPLSPLFTFLLLEQKVELPVFFFFSLASVSLPLSPSIS